MICMVAVVLIKKLTVHFTIHISWFLRVVNKLNYYNQLLDVYEQRGLYQTIWNIALKRKISQPCGS
jgi:hypothetical protein